MVAPSADTNSLVLAPALGHLEDLTFPPTPSTVAALVTAARSYSSWMMAIKMTAPRGHASRAGTEVRTERYRGSTSTAAGGT